MCMIWLLALAFGIGGSLIVTLGFSHSFDRETESALRATRMVLNTLKIVVLGVVAFGISTAGGLLGGNVMCKLTGKKVNPLIGSAGVSAVPMAARVANVQGQKANPSNFLLMHAMGPNVAGVIGSAIAAGFLLSVFG